MKNSSMASLLGYAGLIPFVALAAAEAWHDTPIYREALIAYGATILAFLGGAYWGRSLQVDGGTGPSPGRLVIAVTPQLVGWIALLLGATSGTLVLMVALGLMLAVDLDGVRRGIFPTWYRPLRWGLTTVAAASLGLSLV